MHFAGVRPCLQGQGVEGFDVRAPLVFGMKAALVPPHEVVRVLVPMHPGP